MEEKNAFKPAPGIFGWNFCGIMCLVFSILFFILNRKLLYGNLLELSMEAVQVKLAAAAALLLIPILWCGSVLALGIWNHDTASRLKVGKRCVLLSFLIILIFVALFLINATRLS